MNNKYINVGYTQKPHGVKGELKVYIEDDFWETFDDFNVVYLKEKGHYTPYFIEYWRGTTGNIIKFEDINSPEKALKLAHKELHVPTASVNLKELSLADSLPYQYIIGFSVVDKEVGVLSKIKEVLEFPQQEMGVIIYKEKEVLIPLNDYIIVEIKEDEKTILVDLPEGLLDL